MIDIYLACPYSRYSDIERELVFQNVNKIASDLIRAGLTVFSPISHSHSIAKYGLPKEWHYWDKFDIEMLSICKVMVIYCYPDWENSQGIQKEIEITEKMGKQIVKVCTIDIDPFIHSLKYMAKD
jgi:hypothetical protein